MRAVVQRVIHACVRVDTEVIGEIGAGLLVYVGVADSDGAPDVAYLADKIPNLRIFPDADGVMNRSAVDSAGQLLFVSQFTLYADARKGRRPSYSAAALPDLARERYEQLVRTVEATGLRVREGRFRAHMVVESANDGPVTVLLDSRRLF